MIDIESELNNLAELLYMKDPATYTTVETSLLRFISWYSAVQGSNRD